MNEVKAITEIIDTNIGRLKQFQDRATRSVMFLHTLFSLTDISVALMLNGFLGDPEYQIDDEIKKKCQMTRDKLQKEINNVMLVCQSQIGEKIHTQLKPNHDESK